MKFAVADRVRKIGGSYEATGWIVASFRTRAGLERYVMEFDVPKGLLHIFGPDQLVREGYLTHEDIQAVCPYRSEFGECIYPRCDLRCKGRFVDRRKRSGD